MKYEIMQKISSLAVSDCGQYIGIGCHNGDVQCLSSRKLNLIQRNVFKLKVCVRLHHILISYESYDMSHIRNDC